MQREDLIGGIGAIGSTLVVVLGYLWNIGLIQLMFSFLAGSFFTYLIQHRLQVESEKRRIAREHVILMRDEVYGPLYQIMNEIFENLEKWSYFSGGKYDKSMEGLQEVMNHYLFLLTEKELRIEVSQICDDLAEYREARSKAVGTIYDMVEIKFSETYGERVDPNSIHFILKDHELTVEYVNIIDAVLKRINPLKSFKEAMVILENPTIEIHVSGIAQKDTKKVDELFKEVEQLAWKENRLLVHEELRKKIIEDLRMIIPKLQKRIVV